MQPSTRSLWNFRLGVVCFAALAVSFPVAWVSLSKLLLFLSGVGYIITGWVLGRARQSWKDLRSVKVILLIVFSFSASLLWTPVDLDFAQMALVKHAKLLTVILLIVLIQSSAEARVAMTVFALGQLSLLVFTLLLAWGAQLPWESKFRGDNVVFSSYLDQSTMLASSAAIFWYLRHRIALPAWVGAAIASTLLATALFLLEGRTAYIIAIVSFSLALMWKLPKHLRLMAIIVVPLVVSLGLYVLAPPVKERVDHIVSGTQAYVNPNPAYTSEGWRLNAWHRSLQAIADSPVVGHGVGSWALSVRPHEGDSYAKRFGKGNSSNPHQELLLWGVELGLWGIALFVALFVALALDAKRFSDTQSRIALSMIAALAIACMFNSMLYDALIGDYFCVALGLCMALGLQELGQPKASR
jgi:O-antigen ligase